MSTSYITLHMLYDVFYPFCVRYQFFFVVVSSSSSSLFVRLYSVVVIASVCLGVSVVCRDWKLFAISYIHTHTHLTQCHLHSGWFSTLCKQFWHTTNLCHHSEWERERDMEHGRIYMVQVFGTKTARKKVNICVITLFDYALESLFQLNENCRSLLELIRR